MTSENRSSTICLETSLLGNGPSLRPTAEKPPKTLRGPLLCTNKLHFHSPSVDWSPIRLPFRARSSLFKLILLTRLIASSFSPAILSVLLKLSTSVKSGLCIDVVVDSSGDGNQFESAAELKPLNLEFELVFVLILIFLVILFSRSIRPTYLRRLLSDTTEFRGERTPK